MTAEIVDFSPSGPREGFEIGDHVAASALELPVGTARAGRELVRGLRPLFLGSFTPAEADSILADMEKRVLRICDKVPKWELPDEAVITLEELQKYVTNNFLLAVNEVLCLEIELYLTKQTAGAAGPP